MSPSSRDKDNQRSQYSYRPVQFASHSDCFQDIFCFVFSPEYFNTFEYILSFKDFQDPCFVQYDPEIFWIVDLKIIYWGDCCHCSKTKPGAKSDLKSSGLKQSFLKWSNLVFFSGANFSFGVMCYFSVQFYSHSRQRCQGLHRKTFIGQYTLCLFAFPTSQSSHRCILCTSTVDQIHVTPLKGSNVD